eukprot:jgi/Mesvir1/14980/Mv14642-RA.1
MHAPGKSAGSRVNGRLGTASAGGLEIRVLLVDDERLSRLVVGKMLQKCGCCVTVVDGGQSAIDWLDRNGDAVDLVLTDVNMPNVDGFAVLKHIKSSPVLENVPVIMVSPRVHRALTDRCASLGADGCVAKPIPRPYVEQLCQHVHQRNVSGAGVRNVSGAVSAGAGGSIGAAPDAVFRDGGGRAGGMVRRRRTHACSRCSSREPPKRGREDIDSGAGASSARRATPNTNHPSWPYRHSSPPYAEAQSRGTTSPESRLTTPQQTSRLRGDAPRMSNCPMMGGGGAASGGKCPIMGAVPPPPGMGMAAAVIGMNGMAPPGIAGGPMALPSGHGGFSDPLIASAPTSSSSPSLAQLLTSAFEVRRNHWNEGFGGSSPSGASVAPALAGAAGAEVPAAGVASPRAGGAGSPFVFPGSPGRIRPLGRVAAPLSLLPAHGPTGMAPGPNDASGSKLSLSSCGGGGGGASAEPTTRAQPDGGDASLGLRSRSEEVLMRQPRNPSNPSLLTAVTNAPAATMAAANMPVMASDEADTAPAGSLAGGHGQPQRQQQGGGGGSRYRRESIESTPGPHLASAPSAVPCLSDGGGMATSTGCVPVNAAPQSHLRPSSQQQQQQQQSQYPQQSLSGPWSVVRPGGGGGGDDFRETNLGACAGLSSGDRDRGSGGVMATSSGWQLGPPQHHQEERGGRSGHPQGGHHGRAAAGHEQARPQGQSQPPQESVFSGDVISGVTAHNNNQGNRGMAGGAGGAGAAAPIRELYAGTLRHWLMTPGRTVDHHKCSLILVQVMKLVAATHVQSASASTQHLPSLRPSHILLLEGGRVGLEEEPDAGKEAALRAAAARSHDPWAPLVAEEPHWYTSPEELQGHPRTPMSCVYSLGVLFFELFCPWLSERDHLRVLAELRHRITPPTLLQEWPKEAAFMLWMLHPEAAARPSLKAILASELACAVETEMAALEAARAADEAAAREEVLYDVLSVMLRKRKEQAAALEEDLALLATDLALVEQRWRQLSPAQKNLMMALGGGGGGVIKSAYPPPSVSCNGGGGGTTITSITAAMPGSATTVPAVPSISDMDVDAAAVVALPPTGGIHGGDGTPLTASDVISGGARLSSVDTANYNGIAVGQGVVNASTCMALATRASGGGGGSSLGGATGGAAGAGAAGAETGGSGAAAGGGASRKRRRESWAVDYDEETDLSASWQRHILENFHRLEALYFESQRAAMLADGVMCLGFDPRRSGGGSHLALPGAASPAGQPQPGGCADPSSSSLMQPQQQQQQPGSAQVSGDGSGGALTGVAITTGRRSQRSKPGGGGGGGASRRGGNSSTTRTESSNSRGSVFSEVTLARVTAEEEEGAVISNVKGAGGERVHRGWAGHSRRWDRGPAGAVQF